jgi:UDP-N-acetylglucosamine 2-epimerase
MQAWYKMNKLKVMTIVGTRPEIIRLSRVIHKLDNHCDHVFVHSGQNYDYELNQIFFNDFGLRQPDHFLDSANGSTSAAETIGKLIIAADKVMDTARPDALLVLGDTNSCLSVIPAKRRKIPIFHMEAGNRCFDQRVPEETNRRIVDHTSDVNLTYSTIAREYLLREGLPPDLVIKTGSPLREVLTHFRPKIDASPIIKRLELHEGQYFVVSAHREENIEPPESFTNLVAVLNMIATTFDLPVIVSTHPRTRNRIAERDVSFDARVQLIPPLGFHDYVRLQLGARAVLSDSGTITEESSILSFPALNLREAHERPEGMEEAAVMMVGLSPERVLQGLAVLDRETRGIRMSAMHPVADYEAEDVSDKVIRILHSYTDYVNRVVWRKTLP